MPSKWAIGITILPCPQVLLPQKRHLTPAHTIRLLRLAQVDKLYSLAIITGNPGTSKPLLAEQANGGQHSASLEYDTMGKVHVLLPIYRFVNMKRGVHHEPYFATDLCCSALAWG